MFYDLEPLSSIEKLTILAIVSNNGNLDEGDAFFFQPLFILLCGRPPDISLLGFPIMDLDGFVGEFLTHVFKMLFNVAAKLNHRAQLRYLVRGLFLLGLLFVSDSKRGGYPFNQCVPAEGAVYQVAGLLILKRGAVGKPTLEGMSICAGNIVGDHIVLTI